MAEYQKLTVVKLKELLKDRGLPVAGKKADLVERLEEDDAQAEGVDQNEPNAEINDTNKQDYKDGGILQAVPMEDESGQEPPIELIQGVITQEKESQPHQEEAANQDENLPQSTATTAVEEEELAKVTTPTELNQQSDTQITESNTRPQEDAKDSVNASAQIQNPRDDRQLITTESQPNGLTEEEGTGGSKDDVQMPDQHEMLAPALSDHEAMPAPELPATQIPRHSIETPQIQEQKRESQSAEPNLGFEAITRTATMSAANTQEILEDRNKRKRRSHSPPISSEEVALKKAKALDGTPRATSVLEGQEVSSTQASMDVDGPGQPGERMVSRDSDVPISENQPQESLHQPSGSRETQISTERDNQSGPPSRHPPTNCLYINNLMRPLQPNALRAHLEKLAHSDADNGAETIGLFFLESTRRYGLVSFSSVALAARARLGLHDHVWPNESNRKALFVDFIPENQAHELVKMEEDNASKPRQQRSRFEILYMDRNGETTPEIHDADSPAAIHYRAKQTISSSTMKQQTQTPATLPPAPREESGKNFKALDELFLSTSTKPRLYYLPVSADKAEKRLDTLSRATMPSDMVKPSTGTEEKRRYTFEDSGIVDKGPEFGFGRGGGGARGRGGYGGDRGDRGGYHGRGRGGPRGDFKSDYRSGAGIGYHDRR